MSNTNCPLGMTLQAAQVSPANPVEPVVTLAEMYAQCRLDPTGSPPTHPDDDLIELAVASATQELCGLNGEGWLGRALMRQHFELTLDRFPPGRLALPLPPLVEVTGLTYLDADGVETVVDVDDYQVVTNATPGFVLPAYGTAWPYGGRVQPGAVRLTYIAGYEAREDVPAPIRQWIKARAGFYYENREAIITGTIATVIPEFPSMLENYRVRGVFVK